MAPYYMTRFSLFAVNFLTIWAIADLLQISDASNTNDNIDNFRPEMIAQIPRKQSGQTGLKPFPKIVPDNGMFHFVLKDIAQELVHLLEEQGLSLSGTHKDAIHDKLESIYDRSKDHPALESDIIAYSPKKPDFHRYTPDSVLRTRAQERREKRAYRGEIHELCQSEERWESMVTANLRNHTLVKVLPGFEFHMRACTWFSEDEPCLGMSPGFGETSCQTTGTWVRALVCGGCNFNVDPNCNDRCPNVRDLYHWEWVYTPTCCKCAYTLF
ncbi:uncharacterized protein LOC110985728 [Acanthaster planci]|uniref:Uncharacterized protein LOC110985728 n=1 Tax=Acanthaster planci TaxID=133434 RepID=A0A8B7ZCS6_ACAPL|nr:uncharacterized protein LOC110985728 [Acanthaster planci]